jgi:sulfur transfer protein SufE
MPSKVATCPHVLWHSMSWADDGEVKMNFKAYGEGAMMKTLVRMVVNHVP